jgi:flagellar basal-body rod protein FlgB
MAGIANITDLLEAGIRAEGLRQQTIAENISNMETPGYRRLEVDFEDQLLRLLKRSDRVSLEDLHDLDAEPVQPESTPVKHNGNDVSMEMEVGNMLKNSLRHKTYMRLLAKKYAQIQLAIDVR